MSTLPGSLGPRRCPTHTLQWTRAITATRVLHRVDPAAAEEKTRRCLCFQMLLQHRATWPGVRQVARQSNHELLWSSFPGSPGGDDASGITQCYVFAYTECGATGSSLCAVYAARAEPTTLPHPPATEWKPSTDTRFHRTLLVPKRGRGGGWTRASCSYQMSEPGDAVGLRGCACSCLRQAAGGGVCPTRQICQRYQRHHRHDQHHHHLHLCWQ